MTVLTMGSLQRKAPDSDFATLVRAFACVALFIACTFVLCPSHVEAASKRLKPPHASVTIPPPRPKWTITVDPLTTLLGFVHVQIERAIGEHMSIYIGPHLRFFDSVFGNVQGDFWGIGVELCFRYYFMGGAPFRWWVGVRGVLASLATNIGRQKAAFGGYVSILIGYSWLLFGWLTLAAGVGGQYLHYQIEGKDPDKPMGVKGFLPALHTNLGIAF